MEGLKKTSIAVVSYLVTFIKWVVTGLCTGVVIGSVGTLFRISIEYVTGLRIQNPWMIYFLPFAGMLIVLSYRMLGVKESRGTNLILTTVRTEESVPIKMAPLIFFGTVLTHMFGGSAGREGAALQLGGSIAQRMGRLLRFSDKELRIMTMCGMSACFAALFGTPITATVFSMEVISVGVMHYSALVPCAVSSITGFCMTELFGFSVWKLPAVIGPSEITVLTSLRVLLLAAAAAVVSIIFCLALKWGGRLYRKYIENQYLRVALGGAAVVLLYILTGGSDYLGSGTPVIERALSGNAASEAFLLKILFTALTLEAGFKGGEIVPTLFIGSTFGCFFGRLIGLPAGFGAALGLISLFCGVTNCPLASLFLSIELFGTGGILWFLLSVAVSYMLSGYFGLYSKQKILYSKEMPEFIDATCH